MLEGCDFDRFRPWLLAVEATEPCTYTPSHEEWEQLFLALDTSWRCSTRSIGTMSRASASNLKAAFGRRHPFKELDN